MPFPTISWENNAVKIIDQTKLPLEKKYLFLNTKKEMWEAIHQLKIRGAPAIGIAAAFGVYLGVRDFEGDSRGAFFEEVESTISYLNTSRPTAVNLFWATSRIRKTVRQAPTGSSPAELKQCILEEAEAMIEEDNKTCRAIAENGLTLLRDGYSVLTHCNTGGLATAMYGTALGPLLLAPSRGIDIHVFVDETRPLLQGARLTAWELLEAEVPATLITDNTAAFVMAQGKVDCVFLGADRIAANGDTANKIGTLSVAIAAKEYDIPFYVFAPLSTFDLSLETGSGIPIEERSHEEVTRGFGKQTAPDGVAVYNPAFDVTPASYISGIVTETGIIDPPFEENIKMYGANF